MGAAVPTITANNGAATRNPLPIIEARGVTVGNQVAEFRNRGISIQTATPSAASKIDPSVNVI